MDFEIRPLTTTNAESIRKFLGTQTSLMSQGFEPETLVKFETAELLEALAHGRGTVLAAYLGDSLKGIIHLQPSSFDSSVYGIKIGAIARFFAAERERDETLHSLLLTRLFDVGRELGIEHLTCKIAVSDVAARHALERNRFLLMDTSVEYSWKTSAIRVEESEHSLSLQTSAGLSSGPIKILKLGASFRPCTPADLPELERIARQSFTQDTLSHYAVDPLLPLEKTGDFYAQWVRNAALGQFGDLLLVACLGERLVGFQAFRREHRFSEITGIATGSMGIGAVDPEYRGGGIFPGLMVCVLRWCNEAGIHLARGTTLVNNFRMHRTCVATGSIIRNCYHSFHRPLK